jgi:cellulose synthase/poly-beta-1,6-N-acetylglucosamine synthase-like glycosyltransferase
MTTSDAILHLVSLGCLAVCVWVYCGYPLFLIVLGWLHPRPIRRAFRPASVSVIVVAHDEEEVIATKVDNTLRLDYPRNALEIIIACDGCKDETAARARRAAAGCASVLELPRCGKALALNAAVQQSRGEILVLTDANTMLGAGSLKVLLEPFSDPEVGGVCGNQKHRRPRSGSRTGHGESSYWRFDKWIKSLESRCGSTVAADGALYALRRDLFVPITEPAQADDMAISMRVVLRGARLVYEPRAVAFEDPPGSSRDEFRRKIRVTNHSLRALLNLGPRLWSSGLYSLELLSHKLLRHLVPLFLVGLALASGALALSSPLLGVLATLQAIFYSAAGLAWVARGTIPARWRLLTMPYYFCVANGAALVGICTLLAGRRASIWTPRRGIDCPKPELR